MERVKVESFLKELVNLYSKERLESYQDIKEHNKNLHFIAKISYKIAILEISLRNVLDFCLKEEIGEEWIINNENEYFKNKVLEIIKKEKAILKHHQILSRLTLGTIIRLIQDFKLQNAIFNFRELDFKKYGKGNRNFVILGGKKRKFTNMDKVDIVLNLLLLLRNRSFHWENLTKTIKINGICYSRIYATQNGTYISLDFEKIEEFLENIINKINGKLLCWLGSSLPYSAKVL